MSFGLEAEKLVQKHLESLGYEILSRNYRSRFGEIDIIALDNKCLVFVEVKARTNTSFGHPLESITYKKLAKLIKTSEFYISEKKWSGEFRFDAVEVFKSKGVVSINQVKNITL